MKNVIKEEDCSTGKGSHEFLMDLLDLSTKISLKGPYVYPIDLLVFILQTR